MLRCGAHKNNTMEDRWIFQDIADLEKAMHKEADENNGWVLGSPLRHFCAALREKVPAEIYTQYLLWRCDIFVDVYQICQDVCNVYFDITPLQVVEWLEQHKEEHHDLRYPMHWLDYNKDDMTITINIPKKI